MLKEAWKLFNGIDVLKRQNCSILAGRKIGLITNQTGISQDIEQNWQILLSSPHLQLKALFSPEHGFFGAVQDTLKVTSSVHKPSGLPIYSLFAETTEPNSEMLSQIDTLVFDIQDIGVRFYTYGVTLFKAYQKALTHGLDFVILDRPNLLGRKIGGNILEKEAASFLGLPGLAWQHGLTLGELGLFLGDKAKPPLVIKCEEYDPLQKSTINNLPWVAPSPNIPFLNTVKVYPGTCLFEGTNVSEGRGTTQPFEIIGAPFLDGNQWANRLNRLMLPGVKFRAVEFIPTFWRYKDEKCEGVVLHILNEDIFDPILTGITMLHDLVHNCPEFAFTPDLFDRLAGKRLRSLLVLLTPTEILRYFETELSMFAQKVQPYLLY